MTLRQLTEEVEKELGIFDDRLSPLAHHFANFKTQNSGDVEIAPEQEAELRQQYRAFFTPSFIATLKGSNPNN